MSHITVEQRDNVLVVDSRLVAQELGIEHRSFVKALDKYESHIEKEFGILRFEIAEIKGRGQPARFAWLAEDQAIFVMTLSRNTDQVVRCKANLVKAFSAAKQQLQECNGHQPQPESTDAMKLQLELAQVAERLEAV
ncbi:MAG: Rha family transcriptional regulator [Leptolyngbya sp. SIO1D8]|nr:Rha family transcriptional regulator [Leptolyngbya sp. SIO1D8]